MQMVTVAMMITLPLFLAAVCGFVYLFVLVCKALKKFIASKEVREEKKTVKKALAEVLKEYRYSCKMTQEFVADSLGVSRQAVSKWESGASEPTMSNLIALAKLYGTTVEEIVSQVRSTDLQSK